MMGLTLVIAMLGICIAAMEYGAPGIVLNWIWLLVEIHANYDLADEIQEAIEALES